ncbi:MAG: MATE family efflux transporter, partial [Oscillospiraceae bacterium]
FKEGIVQLMFKQLRREPGFYRRLMALALPLVLQNLITTSLGFVDTFMVGLLGNAEMAAVTAANAPIFLVQVIIFGLMSGLCVLVSQYWGRGDTDAINRVMGVAMYAGVLVSSLVAIVLLVEPFAIMRLLTPNETLVQMGAPYLRIVGVSYIFNSISSVYVAMQRSTENPAFGMQVFTVSMLANTLLNYMFIFGKLGAPALGITGAAVATLSSRVLEFAIVVLYGLKNKRIPLRFSNLFRPGMEIFKSFLRYSSPVMCNETLWGLGTTCITMIMGHMAFSTEMLAAYAIMGNIDKFSTVTCFGLAGATAVLVGKRIGEGAKPDEVYSLGICLLTVATAVGIVVGLALGALLPTFFLPVLYPLFQLSPLATEIAVTMAILFACTMPMRAFDISNITGLLRAGGDAKMASVIDLTPLWCAAIPLTAFLALVVHAPVFWICLAIQSESIFKMPLGVFRLRSRKWINDITRGARP